MIDLFIRTRGIKRGHQFLIKKPNIPEPNSYHTDLEKPTCILEKYEPNPSDLYLFLYGIPSERKDRQGSPIQYDLVARVSSNSSDTEKEKDYLSGLTLLVWIWLNEVKEALMHRNSATSIQIPLRENSKLGQKLDDDFFPEEYVEELLEATYNQNWTNTQEEELDKRLKDFISELAVSYPSTEENSPGDLWWGGVNDDESCRIWIKLVEKILKGETHGKALVLNGAILQSLEQLSSLKNQEIGVLLAKEFSESKPQVISSPQAIPSNRRNSLGLVVAIALIMILTNMFSFLLGINSSFQSNNNIRKYREIQNENNQLQIEKKQLQIEIVKLKNEITSLKPKYSIAYIIDDDSDKENKNEEKPLDLIIKGTYKKTTKPTEICFYSVVNNKEHPLKCSKNLIDKNGNWEFKYQFGYIGTRTIKIEKHLPDSQGTYDTKYQIDWEPITEVQVK